MPRAIAIATAAFLLTGCGSNKPESLPAACTGGPTAILKALASAPRAVTLGGTTPISHCFNRNASGGDTQVVGTFLLSVAQQLGDKARRGDDHAALQLGYLVGATQRGSKRNGLGAEIVRRLQVETDGLRAGRSAYRRGLLAGRTRG
jgi:hypothetical protein